MATTTGENEMTTYYLDLRGGGGNESYELEADTLDEAIEQIQEEADEWCADGAWGDDGASVEVYWHLYANSDQTEEMDSGSVTVEIEPDHDALIRAAGGDPDCEHEWSSKGEGGCDENPGVWSIGGTSMMYAAHCTKCRLHRVNTTTGVQRNPGEHDTVEYEQPVEIDN
jgi:hypothetical protein